jgi:hypothetical protein
MRLRPAKVLSRRQKIGVFGTIETPWWTPNQQYWQAWAE